VADAGRLDLDKHLALARPFEVDLHDLKRLSGSNSYGGAGFHGDVPSSKQGANVGGKVSGFANAFNRQGDAGRSQSGGCDDTPQAVSSATPCGMDMVAGVAEHGTEISR
jgi:hypothetical protein